MKDWNSAVMTPRRARPGRLILLLIPVLTTCALAAPTESTDALETSLSPTGYVYLDVDDKPLPFQDRPSILEALRTAAVVDKEVMSRGVANNLKLVLEIDGVRFHAVFRAIDVQERVKTSSNRIVLKYRDSWAFEIAAYELNELLGMGRIPPVLERIIDGVRGSVQIWMEGTTPEDILFDEGRLDPPNQPRWWQQKSIMWVFDALIANTDRNQGNLLIDDDWNIWLIDQTRAFRETATLFDKAELTICERRLWEAIQTTPDDAIRSRVEDYLTSREVTKLLLRRAKLVTHIRKQIEKHGEDQVLFDLER